MKRSATDNRYWRGATDWRLMAPAELAAHRAECDRLRAERDRLAGLVVVLALALAQRPERG